MGRSKGCHDNCAAAIIFIFNSVALILSIAGLAGVCYIWYTQANPESDGLITLSVATPVAILGVGIIVCLFVLTIALLGIITTCIELRANKNAEKNKGKNNQPEPKKDKDGKVKAPKAPKRCCHNAGLLVYIGLSLFAFFFMLIVAIIAGVYSGKLDQVNYITQAKATGDEWIDVLESQVSGYALDMKDKYPETWNGTQALMGCCGWNVTTATAAETAAAAETTAAGRRLSDDTTTTTVTTTTLPFNHADVLAYSKESKCCIGKTVKAEYSADDKMKYDANNCWIDETDGHAYTCQGLVAHHMQGNMVKICGCAVGFALVQLALAIAGCVVRFPVLYSYCACCCKGKKKKNQVAAEPTDTPVQVL